MRPHDFLSAEGARHWFLDTPEAQVLSASRERELLLELDQCRRGLLHATRRPDGTAWDLARPDAEFRRAVRGLGDRSESTGTEPLPDLARRYDEIRGLLAMANARLVMYIARRYLNRGIAPADLLQEGFCGLLEAIDRFDPVNTTRLATYASWWIRQSIQRAIADGSYPVRLTPRQVRRLAQSLPCHHHDEATTTPINTEEPAEPISHPEAEPAATWYELAAIRPRVSLDAVTGREDSTPLAEILAFPTDEDREADDQVESVHSLLDALNPRERMVVKLRYGLEGNSRHSLSQIGEVLGVSKERVRQIQDRALRKLREVAVPAEAEHATAGRSVG